MIHLIGLVISRIFMVIRIDHMNRGEGLIRTNTDSRMSGNFEVILIVEVGFSKVLMSSSQFHTTTMASKTIGPNLGLIVINIGLIVTRETVDNSINIIITMMMRIGWVSTITIPKVNREELLMGSLVMEIKIMAIN